MQLLAGILITAFVIGIAFVSYNAYLAWKKHRARPELPSSQLHKTAVFLERMKQDFPKKLGQTQSDTVPKSFGVYLGSFENPPTENQQRLLSAWDLIVVNPAEQGVLNAVSTACKSSHILGRLDVEATLAATIENAQNEPEKVLAAILQTLSMRFTRPSDSESPFTGVLVANWQKFLPLFACNSLIQFIDFIGLEVYIEASPPEYLTLKECFNLDLETAKGIVFQNGTILPDGDRRNYYQMAEMRQTLRALASKSQMSQGQVLMWETVETASQLNHGVVKRSANWCRYYSAMTWIGSRAALTNADIAVKETVPGEPLGALSYIKDDLVVKVHETWRYNTKITQQPSDHKEIYDTISDFVPNIFERLSMQEHVPTRIDPESGMTLDSIHWPPRNDEDSKDPFAFSPRGHAYTGLGCFQIGLDAFHDDFSELIAAQRQLKDLGLLKPVEASVLQSVIDQLKKLTKARLSGTDISHTIEDIEELTMLLEESLEECEIEEDDEDEDKEEPSLRIFMGLHSGFRTSLDHRFWGLYDLDGYLGGMDMFISLKAGDLAGTILHTFLSAKQHSRTQCLLAEVALAVANNTLSPEWDIPLRFVKDIEGLTPTEAILFLRRADAELESESALLAAKVRVCCEHQLLEIPTVQQLRTLSSASYLRGETSAKELIESRLAWHQEKGCPLPDATAALKVFEDIDRRLPAVLFAQQEEMCIRIRKVMEHILAKDQIDPRADIFCLSVFCAFRRLAIYECYLEILDRNPLPNPHPDQAACFAEMFALGARCEAFFDMTPNQFGRILAEWYDAYYKIYQPPPRDDKLTDVPTSYASKQVELNVTYEPEGVPWYYQVTFLGIFAFPALIDIMCLTTIGRGLYLSSYMNEDEKRMATTALMIALALTGAIGTWIGSGGSYYLFSMAFPAMNMFVLTRWVAGVALCLTSGLFGFILIAAIENPYAAFIFFYYLVLLTTYLTTLAALAIYQLPGFMFQSGRTIVASCIPILFISPILTLFIGHDIIVYLIVLTIFLAVLLYGASKIMSAWATWYLDIPFVTDKEVVQWYVKTKMSNEKDLPLGVTDISTTPLPRIALAEEVEKERKRSFWTKPTTDEFVLRAVRGYPATHFLMSWYCQYSRTVMPFLYSTTWNLQCKAAIDTLLNMQKGLKFHSAFVHWRYSGDEVYCGILYFIIALMDKWVALLSGGSLVGLSNAQSADFRLPVGFALSYYLISAIFLDAVAQPLWPKANKVEPVPIHSLKGLQDVARYNANQRRKIFWSNLTKFFLMHIWALAFSATLLWVFQDNEAATIMFACYVGAYTGLLFYQYNRIFTGTLALPDLLISAAAGLIVGLVIVNSVPTFPYGSIVALAVCCWTAALLSLSTAKVGWPKYTTKARIELDDHRISYYTASALGLNTVHSRSIIYDMYRSIQSTPEESRYILDPRIFPGLEVNDYMRNQANNSLPNPVRPAFVSGDLLIHEILDMWDRGDVVVDLIPSRQLGPQEQKMLYVSRFAEGILHLCILLPLEHIDGERVLDVNRNCKVISEAILQGTTQAIFGFSPGHAAVSQVLALDDIVGNELTLPETMRRQLDTEPDECTWFTDELDHRMLRHALLDLDCDRDWDLLPRTVRNFLLRRCRGGGTRMIPDQIEWVCARFGKGDTVQVREYVNRCNLEADVCLLVEVYIKRAEQHRYDAKTRVLTRRESIRPISRASRAHTYVSEEVDVPEKKYEHVTRMIPDPIIRIHQMIRVSMKFFIVAITADPEFQRELDYVLSTKPRFVRWGLAIWLDGLWMFCRALQNIVIPAVQIQGRPHIVKLQKGMKGTKVTLHKNSRIVVESGEGDYTCFFNKRLDGGFELRQFAGLHLTEPEGAGKLLVLNSYSEKLVLRRRQEYSKGTLSKEYIYDYSADDPKRSKKLPISRKLIQGSPQQELVEYDERGYISSGSYIRDGNLTQFTFWYRDNAKHDDELLRAEYITDHMTIDVLWSIPSPKHPNNPGKAIPYSHVIAARFVKGQDVWHSKWTYDHRSHPIIDTKFNGTDVATPPMVSNDWFKVLKKPTNSIFAADDPLFLFKSTKTSILERIFRTNIHYFPISTSLSRKHLWKTWKNSKDIDAVTARWLDEWILRKDSTLKPYWRARDVGKLTAAQQYLDTHTDTLMARVDFDQEISSWTAFAFKTADLYSFGQGGDSLINTRSVKTQIHDTDKELHVLAMDTGTWPNEGGGVSACRRDMVNDLTTVRWHVVAECASDYGYPKFQIERNVSSLSILPLWGLDYLTPCHGIFENSLDSQIQEKANNTSDDDIRNKFIPILTTLVRCARAIKLDHEHIEQGTKALLDLNKYFESSRHWSEIWMSQVVKDSWAELWLTEDMENTRPISEWMEAEHPTLSHLENALDMWQRYLFIFSLQVPESIPDVFQASHHFAGASYGIICKIKRGCAFHVWDHCISWREVTVFLSSSMSFDPPFVCTSLILLSRILSVLTLHHADVVLPCADFFNPGWEVELGSVEGTICHRKTYARKIDPVVNGICNMEKFEPIKEITSEKPTAVMLSHVRFVKDIKAAILAADIIINEWNLKDYRLDIYGDMEKAPAYATECQEIIAAKGLRDYVVLRGLGSPSQVLKQAWLFLNSSVSEGLPLAMGEAALTGVPVVCTDVGASFRVVTDMATGKPFSAVCSPNDVYALAKAQIAIMGLLGEWAEFADDPPGVLPPELPLKPTAEQSAAVAKRMYEKANNRRKLGMRGRANVLSSFSSERYLREHEQMLWLAKHQSQNYRQAQTPLVHRNSNEVYTEKNKGGHYFWYTRQSLG